MGALLPPSSLPRNVLHRVHAENWGEDVAVRYPTLEIRTADVCLQADDAVLIAALARALVDTEARRWHAGQPTVDRRAELLRLAAWRASRSGMEDVLLNPFTGLPEQSAAVTNLLLEHVRDALTDAGEFVTVTGLLNAVLRRGNGAAFRRSTLP